MIRSLAAGAQSAAIGEYITRDITADSFESRGDRGPAIG